MASPRPTAARKPALPQTVAAVPVPPGRVCVKLDSAPAIFRELGRVYRAARSRAIPTSEAASLAWILHTMAKLHESEAFERRLRALEQRPE